LEWVITVGDRGSCSSQQKGEKPVELHPLFVPERGLEKERRAKTRRSGSGVGYWRERILQATADPESRHQSVFKRVIKRGWVIGRTAGNPTMQLHYESSLRTAWKYVYLLRLGDRWTRYIE
jgi:hypothetical protein